MDKITTLLMSPVFPDSEKTRQAAMLNVILWATLVVTLVANGMTFLFATQFWLPLFSTLLVAVPVGTSLWLLRRGMVRLASWVFVLFMWLVISLLIYLQGGLMSPTLSSYLLVVLVSGLLLGGRASYFFVVMSTLVITFFSVEGLLAYLPTPLYTANVGTRWLGVTSALLVLAVLLHLALKNLTDALRKARDAQARYERLFDSAPMMYVVTEWQGDVPVIVDCNRRFLQTLGYWREDVLRRPVADFYAPESIRKMGGLKYGQVMTQEPQEEERTLVTRDERHLETVMYRLPEVNAGGRLGGLLAMYVDVTQRNEAERRVQEYAELLERRVQERTEELTLSEQKLRQQTEILQAILQSMAEGVVVADETGQYLLFNAAAEQILGPKTIGTPFAELAEAYPFYGPDQQTMFALEQNPLWRAVQGEQVRGMELWLRPRTDTGDRWLLCNAAPLAPAVNEGKRTGVTVFSDITSLKKAQHALENHADLLVEQNEELNAFAHTVAHDLKNPLSQVMGFVELLEFELAPAENSTTYMLLTQVTRGVHKMNSIIDELLLLASVREENVVLEPIAMGEIVQEVLFRLDAKIHEVQSELIVPEHWPLAIGYAPWLEEVWANYLSNALKYGGHPARIELGATPQTDQMIRFWVRDNGLGVSEEQKQQLFNRFTRLDRSRATGHGLGLSIVRRIVEKLGGQVYVESVLGQGSTFGFTLPAMPITHE